MTDEPGASRPGRSTPGRRPTATTSARAVPIYQTTSYTFRDTDARRRPVRAGRGRQHLHPHHEPDPGRARGPRGVARGRARHRPRHPRRAGRPPAARRPRRWRILNLAEAGDHIVSSASLYGGTYNLLPLHAAQARHRGHVRRRPRRPRRSGGPPCARTPRRSSASRSATPSNDMLDIEGVAGVAHDNGVPLIVDNTVPTPYLIRPFEWGADIVVHSATKFLGGHGTSIGGIIVDGGTFDFGASGQLPGLHRARPQLPRPRVLGGARARRLHPQGPRAAAARPRAGHQPVQLVPAPPGHRDAEPAHGAPQRQRPGGGRLPGGPRPGRVGAATPGLPDSPWHERAAKYGRRHGLRLGARLRASRAARRPASGSSRP